MAEAKKISKTSSKTAKSSNKTQDKAQELAPKKTQLKLPETKDILRAGVQFGHETKRWDPRMQNFIYGEKRGIHIIDIAQTVPLLETAGDFLAEAIMRGPVVFLGTKKQASGIIREAAVDAGVNYIDHRWAGGLLTNFQQVKDSLDKLNSYEQQFEDGVANRTKYEVSLIKKEWERLDRLYSGVKNLDKLPTAVFIVDPNFEAGAVRECNYLNIPVVAMVDTNTDPTFVDYPIPANDDAIGSIKLVVDYIKERLKEQTESPFRFTHKLVDYSNIEVEVKKSQQGEIEAAEAVVTAEEDKKQAPVKKIAHKKTKGLKSGGQSGILEGYQKQKVKKIIKKS